MKKFLNLIEHYKVIYEASNDGSDLLSALDKKISSNDEKSKSDINQNTTSATDQDGKMGSDAAMPPSEKDSSQLEDKANQVNDQLSNNNDIIKDSVNELVSFLDDILRANQPIPIELKNLVSDLRKLSTQTDSQKYIDSLSKMFSKENPDQNINYFRKNK